MKSLSEISCEIFRKIIHRIFSRRLKQLLLGFPSAKKMRNQLQLLVSHYPNKKIIIFPAPNCPWGYLFQRPQQIARELGKQGFLVFYCIDTSFSGLPDWSVRGLHLISDNVYLCNDNRNGMILTEFAERSIVWQYWPHQTSIVNLFSNNGAMIIYDCIDHLTTFLPYTQIERDHTLTLKRADLVLATADEISKELKKYRDDIMMVPNAVVYEEFANVDLNKYINSPLFNNLKNIKNKHPIIIGYYGAIANWFDFQIIEHCLEVNDEWCFLLVGQLYPDIQVPKHNRIIQLDRQDYCNLPLLLHFFDVAIIPFIINDITMNTSPVKVFEYMAGGKPVVSTKLTEVTKYSPVLISSDKEEFAENIKKALLLREDVTYVNLLKQCAIENTWYERVNTVINALREKENFNDKKKSGFVG